MLRGSKYLDLLLEPFGAGNTILFFASQRNFSCMVNNLVHILDSRD